MHALLQVEENEEKLNIVIDASELGTWELDLKTNHATYSDRCLAILGFKDIKELPHTQLLDQLYTDDIWIREKAFEKAYSTGLLHYESRILWKDASVHWIEVKGKVFYDGKNTRTHLVGTVRDITEEKFYQQKLQEREQKFRLLADSMPQFVWTSDEKGNLNYFSETVYNYSGLSAQQIAETGWLQMYILMTKKKISAFGPMQ